MRAKIRYGLILWWCVGGAAAAGYAAAGTTGAQILELSPSARAMGMGDVYCAVADDAYALQYNPAGLANIGYTEIPFSSNQRLAGIVHQFAAFAYNMRDITASNINEMGTVAFGWSRLDVGNMMTRDVAGAPLGAVEPRDSVMTIGYGRSLFKDEAAGTFNLGASARFIEENYLPGMSYTGQAFDVGVYWEDALKTLSLGCAATNMGGSISYRTIQADLPLTIRTGAAVRMLDNDLMLAADYVNPQKGKARFNFGGEYWFMKTIALRAGYNAGNDLSTGLSAGLGFSLKQIDAFFFFAREVAVDYAFTQSDLVDSFHQLSFTLKLGAD